MPFVPLLNRSGYTFYSGAIKAEELPALAAEKGYSAVGLCDRDGLYAAVRFYKRAKCLGLLPVLGVELTEGKKLSHSSELSEGVKRERNSACFSTHKALKLPARGALFAFARTGEGYARLCGLVSRRRLEPERFARAAECAAATTGGHVALLASDAALLYALEKAGAEFGSLFARLGGLAPKADGEARAAAEWLGLPVVAAPESYFAEPSGFAVHRLLRAAKHRPPEASPLQWFLAPEEARERFPRDAAALDRAGELAASCQVAYLKVHHPAEFFAALLNNQGGFYGTAAYLEEARRWGMNLLSPDVNLSEEAFAGRNSRLRCGFFSLRGVRQTAMDRLYEERGEGRFQSLEDLLARTEGGLAPAEAEILIRAGACDGFGLHRGGLLNLLRGWTGAPLGARESNRGTGHAEAGLLGFPRVAEAGELYDPSPPVRPVPGLAQALRWHTDSRASGALGRPLSLAEILAGERRSLGFCVTAHPLEPLREWARQRGYTGASDLAARGCGSVRVWGQVITYKRIPTRRTGEAMAFVTLEDPSGLVELIFFPKAYREFGALVTAGRPLVVEGKAADERGALTVTVARAWAIRGVVVPRAVEDRGEAEGRGFA